VHNAQLCVQAVSRLHGQRPNPLPASRSPRVPTNRGHVRTRFLGRLFV
jgi:hypothetical protein